MKRQPVMSSDELVGYLKHTRLCTVLVEGAADAYVYRWIEERLVIDSDVLICTGRDALLEVFKRRNEFPNTKTVFVADKDMWLFSGIPNEYQDLVIFTDGYSIENDLYIKNVMENLLSSGERSAFDNLIHQLAVWFAFEIGKFLNSGHSDCGVHINRVCPEETLCEQYKRFIQFIDPDVVVVENVLNRYEQCLRGKSLFEALIRFLSHKDRVSKFSKYNLMELGVKMENDKVRSLISRINDRLMHLGG